MIPPRTVAFILAAAVLVYLLILGQISLELLRSGDPAGMGLGMAIVALPILGAWIVWRELRFGWSMQRLTADWQESPRDPGGFEEARESVQTRPEDWRAWYALGIVYDEEGDRRRARRAMRRAGEVYRAQRDIDAGPDTAAGRD